MYTYKTEILTVSTKWFSDKANAGCFDARCAGKGERFFSLAICWFQIISSVSLSLHIPSTLFRVNFK